MREFSEEHGSIFPVWAHPCIGYVWTEHHVTFVVTCDPDYAIWTFKYNSEVRNAVRVAIDLPMNWETTVRKACYSTVIAVKTYIESVGKEKISMTTA